MKTFFKRIVPILIVMVLWAIGSQFTSPLFLPQPAKVYSTFVELLKNGVLLQSLGKSFMRITTATFIAATISIPIGLLVDNYKLFRDMVTPITSFMRFMPATAFYPLLMMWVGIGETMKITFIFMATFFYLLPTVILCIRDVSQDYVDTALTMGVSRFDVMFKVLLPAALPSICQSFLMMYGIGWTYVVIAEIVNAQMGLGHLINIASARGRTDMVFVSLFTILTFSYLFDTTGNYLVKRLFKWRYAHEVGE